MDVAEKDQLGGREAASHWYYDAKFALLEKHLRSLPLDSERFTSADVGSGLGLFLHKMEKVGLASPERSVGIDPAYQAPVPAFGSKILIHPHFESGRSFDVVIMMDILEHVEKDKAVLLDAVGHVKKGGYVFITVPALPFLYSSHDRYLGHYRRYTLSSLADLIGSTGRLDILESHYFFSAILPVAVPIRLLRSFEKQATSSDMKPMSPFLNGILSRICRLELAVAGLNRLAGLSVVALCKVQ